MAVSTKLDPLYGTHHKFYGAMDYFMLLPLRTVMPPGLMDARIGGRFRASDKVDMELNYHYFSTAVKVQDSEEIFRFGSRLSDKLVDHERCETLCRIFFMRGTKTMDAVETGNHKSWQDWGWHR